MKVFLDFDNTLVDLAQGWLDWLAKEKYIKVTTKHIKEWDWLSKTYGEHVNEYWKTPNIYDDIIPIPGSITFVEALKRIYGRENILIISNSAKNMIDEKTIFAEKYFKILPTNVLHVADKWKYTSEGVLIDDAPHNVIDHVKANQTPAILFNYRNKWGWANLKEPVKFVTTCINYADCLTELAKIKKKFFSK
jgi:5'(3')-deoxyribonucleotidase